MYQIKEIDGRKINNGYEIVVVGAGDNGLCRVNDGNGTEKFTGTHDECVAWLTARGLTH